MSLRLRGAGPGDLAVVSAMAARYHAVEPVELPRAALDAALAALLADPSLGRVWIVESEGAPIGYAVVGFGFSLEFGGRDGFLDEMFLEAEARGRGLGRAVLGLLAAAARDCGLRALHLEVRKDNRRARAAYVAAGYEDRAGNHLMSKRL